MNKEQYRAGFIRELNEDLPERTKEFILSTGTIDRHRTALNMDGWDLSKYNGNVGYNHNALMGSFFGPVSEPHENIIAKSTVRIEEDKKLGKVLIGRATFEGVESTGNKVAEQVFKKIQFGSLKSTSVGFLEVGEGKMVDNDQTQERSKVYLYGGQELIEWSVVDVPSNHEANLLNLKSLIVNTYKPEQVKELIEELDKKEDERGELTEQEMITALLNTGRFNVTLKDLEVKKIEEVKEEGTPLLDERKTKIQYIISN